MGLDQCSRDKASGKKQVTDCLRNMCRSRKNTGRSCQQYVLVMNLQETRSPNELQRELKQGSISEAPHYRSHSTPPHKSLRQATGTLETTSWPNFFLSRSTARIATTPWTCTGRPGRGGTSVPSCTDRPFGGTVEVLGCSLEASGDPAHGSKRQSFRRLG